MDGILDSSSFSLPVAREKSRSLDAHTISVERLGFCPSLAAAAFFSAWGKTTRCAAGGFLFGSVGVSKNYVTKEESILLRKFGFFGTGFRV